MELLAHSFFRTFFVPRLSRNRQHLEVGLCFHQIKWCITNTSFTNTTFYYLYLENICIYFSESFESCECSQSTRDRFSCDNFWGAEWALCRIVYSGYCWMSYNRHKVSFRRLLGVPYFVFLHYFSFYFVEGSRFRILM